LDSGPEDENDQMSENALSLTAMAEALARSGDYRVLRRLVPRTAITSSIGQASKTGLLMTSKRPASITARTR
jgi:hypothetical protein